MFSNNYYSVSELTQNEIKEFKLDTQFMQGDGWKSKLHSLSVPPNWKKWTPMGRLKKSFFAAVAIGIKKKWKGVGKYEDVTLKEVANVFYPGFMDLVRWWDPPHEARICDVERHYETAIHIYTCNDDLRRDLRGVRWSEITHKKNKNRSILLLYVKGYYFYINNYSALTQVYSCGGCNTMCEGDSSISL